MDIYSAVTLFSLYVGTIYCSRALCRCGRIHPLADRALTQSGHVMELHLALPSSGSFQMKVKHHSL